MNEKSSEETRSAKLETGLFSQGICVHSSWGGFAEKAEDALKQAQKSIMDISDIENLTPPPHLALRFLSVDLNAARVVILGQDPYPRPGAATGRAFEAGGVNSWLKPIRQASLRNILRAVYAVYTGCAAPPLSQVRSDIQNGRFSILPPDKLFADWEAQGVLLLNTSFTCAVGKPGSHTAAWEGFTALLLEFIASKVKPEWFLWGAHAAAYERYTQGCRVYKSRHPMTAGSSRADDFLKCPCFLETKDIVDWTGRS